MISKLEKGALVYGMNLTAYKKLEAISIADTEYPMFANTYAGKQVPVPSPQATERGVHCRATRRMVTIVHIVSTTIEPASSLRIGLLLDAIRYRTRATLTLAT